MHTPPVKVGIPTITTSENLTICITDAEFSLSFSLSAWIRLPGNTNMTIPNIKKQTPLWLKKVI